jgi:hypothetical protein
LQNLCCLLPSFLLTAEEQSTPEQNTGQTGFDGVVVTVLALGSDDCTTLVVLDVGTATTLSGRGNRRASRELGNEVAASRAEVLRWHGLARR